MLLGYARGKVGSLVFSRLKGQQITRAYNANPANPKSRPQMEQRMKLATAVALYKIAVGKFFKFAFEDRGALSSDYNEFIARNIGRVPYVTKEAAQIGRIPVSEIVMASGSLAAIKVVSTTALQNVTNFPTSALIPFTAVADEFKQIDPAGLSTVGALSSALIEANPNIFQNGDLITAVSYRLDDPDSGVTDFAYEQFKLNVESTTAVSSLSSSALVLAGGAEGQLAVNFGRYPTAVGANEALGYGIIVTRNVGGKIYASDCILALNTAATSQYYANRDADSLRVATDSYGVGFTAILNPEGK